MTMPCTNPHIKHIDESTLATLEHHQKHGHGRHKCCQCAYNQGYTQGRALQESVTLDIAALGDSQATADGRHKSVHQAFALGYAEGIADYIAAQ